MNVFVVSVALLSMGGAPENAKKDWMPRYGEALAAAKLAQQPLVVVLEDASNPGRQLSQVQESDESQKQLLKPYVLCRVDVSTPYGKQVASAFKATSFPHTAVIDKTAKYIIYRKRGQFTANEWAHTLVKYRTGTRAVPVASRQPTYTWGQSGFSWPQPAACRT